MILIDTSVLSRAFRRARAGAEERACREAIERLMIGEQRLALPAIVLQEVLSGIRSAAVFAELEHKLVNAFEILHPVTTDYIEAARLRNVCTTRGANVSGLDCLIATQAISGNHQLLAADSDFALLARHSSLALLGVDSAI